MSICEAEAFIRTGLLTKYLNTIKIRVVSLHWLTVLSSMELRGNMITGPGLHYNKYNF